MSKLIIESSNSDDTVTDIEEKLEKAMSSIKSQRERKQFSDPFLKAKKEKADAAVNAVLDNMVDEVAKVLSQ